jgi:hypothetical protein
VKLIVSTRVPALFAAACSLFQTISADRIAQVPGESEQETLRWMAERKKAQEVAAGSSTAFRAFKFDDGLSRSGITFRHTVVDEAGKRFRPNHYDHGTAVAAADVDNDGRTDLYFVDQRGDNELWRNLGNGRFENITSPAGVALKDKVHLGASFADVNNDGWPDLFVTTVKMGNHLFRNEGGGRFRDVTAESGINEVAHSSGAVFFDTTGTACSISSFAMQEFSPAIAKIRMAPTSLLQMPSPTKISAILNSAM